MDVAKRIALYERIGERLQRECDRYYKLFPGRNLIHHYLGNSLSAFHGYTDLLLKHPMPDDKTSKVCANVQKVYFQVAAYLALLDGNEQIRIEHSSRDDPSDDELHTSKFLEKHENELRAIAPHIADARIDSFLRSF